MNDYQVALAIGAAIVGLVSLREARAPLWIILGALSFVGSTLMWRATGTSDSWPAFFAGLMDAIVAVAIISAHRTRWERFLVYIFQGMILVNFAYLTRLIGPHTAYVIALEVLNWAALALIGGKAILGWVGYALASWGRPVAHIDRFVGALEKEKGPGFLYKAK